MVGTPFRVEVLTPEGSIFDEEVGMVSTRTQVGSIGILARMQPLLGMLVPTELRLYRSETDIVTYAQGEGYVQVVGRRRARARRGGPHARRARRRRPAREAARVAESALSSAEDGTEESRRAARDKRRWEAFIAIAEGSR